MAYQWYPGHMTKALRQMQEEMKLIDLVIELIDARAPLSSRNPDIDTLAAGKGRIILLNKSDLAGAKENAAWLAYFQGLGMQAELINARNKTGLSQLSAMVREACKEKIARDARRGIKNRPIRAMVVGIPNVGKSTLINAIAGRGVTKTGDKPGVTKGKQWIRLAKDLEFLDTPGILWPKFEDQEVGKCLAMIGSIRDEILNQEELALELISYVCAYAPQMLTQRYGLDPMDRHNTNAAPSRLLYEIAEKRGCLKKGAEPDTERAAALILEDFRSGRIGRITLEAAPI